jgi:hypothetical protein
MAVGVAFWDIAMLCGELPCQKCGATLSTNEENDYDELGQRAKGLGWVVEYSAGPNLFLILCPDCQH